MRTDTYASYTYVSCRKSPIANYDNFLANKLRGRRVLFTCCSPTSCSFVQVHSLTYAVSFLDFGNLLALGVATVYVYSGYIRWKTLFLLILDNADVLRNSTWRVGYLVSSPFCPGIVDVRRNSFRLRLRVLCRLGLLLVLYRLSAKATGTLTFTNTSLMYE